MTNAAFRLDGVLSSLAIKAPCKAVATSNITLSGEQTVGGTACVANDRVLVIGQTDLTENGIYDASTSAWTRSPDFDGNRDVVYGTLVTVPPTTGSDIFYQVTTANPVVIGTSSISFSLINNPNISYDVIDEETSLGVTIVNGGYKPGQIYRYGTNTVPGTTNLADAVQSAVNVVEAMGGGFVDAEVSETVYLGSTITCDTPGVIIKGLGGHHGQTTFLAGNTTGPVFRFKNRGSGLWGCRINSTNDRYTGGDSTNGHAVWIEPASASADSMSRMWLEDVDIHRQPARGVHWMGGGELSHIERITISDCKGHPWVADNGATYGSTTHNLGWFQVRLREVRCIENGGNFIIAGGAANVKMYNCEGLGNAWDSSVRVSHNQFDIACRDVVAYDIDVEDQQYNNAATGGVDGVTNARTSLTAPSGGIILRSTGGKLYNPHFSSLVIGLRVAASVDNIELLDPVSFPGTYGSDRAMTITGATAASPVVISYTGTDPTNGENVYISGVVGMTELNGNAYEIANVNTGANTFELVDPYSTVDVDGSAFTAYTSGGTATIVMANLFETAQSNDKISFRGQTDLNSGCGNMFHNLSRDAVIQKDNKHYRGTLVSTSDWEISSQGQSATVDGGTLTITADKILITGEGDAADAISLVRYAAGPIYGYNGFRALLVNPNAYLLTLANGTYLKTRNGGDFPLGPGESVWVEYDETSTAWNINEDGMVIATAANIADVGNAINTSQKFIGKKVYDSTNYRVMVATDSAAAGVWSNYDGSTQVTPS